MPPLQVVASTHAPLILASLETDFDPARDQLFHFGVREDAAYVEEIDWAKQGDVVN